MPKGKPKRGRKQKVAGPGGRVRKRAGKERPKHPGYLLHQCKPGYHPTWLVADWRAAIRHVLTCYHPRIPPVLDEPARPWWPSTVVRSR